jgi:hypothetical protein
MHPESTVPPPRSASDPYDFTEWVTSRLLDHVRELEERRDGVPVPRQAAALERELGHTAFELQRRRDDHARMQALLDAREVPLVARA